MTEKVMVNYNMGEERKREEMNDEEMMEKIMNEHDMDKEKTSVVFTDGSKTKKAKAVGAAMVQEGEEEGHYISMDKRCSIFMGEVCAIAKGIQKWIINKDKGKRKENMIIMSDSRSVLKSVEDNKINVYKNIYVTETRKRIKENKVKKGGKIVLSWTPAHVGVKGNEVADELTKIGTREEKNR